MDCLYYDHALVWLDSMIEYVWIVYTGSYERWGNMRHKRGDVYCPHIFSWVVWGNLGGGVTLLALEA